MMRKPYDHLGALGFSGPKPAFNFWVEGEVEAWSPEAQDEDENPGVVSRGSKYGNEEKEGLKKSLKQKEMEHEGVSLQEQLPFSTSPGPNHKAACPELSYTPRQNPIKLWLKDTPTHSPPSLCLDCG
ncbi:zinc finger protein 785-like [Trichechus inunguis]